MSAAPRFPAAPSQEGGLRWRGVVVLVATWLASVAVVETLIQMGASERALLLGDDGGRVVLRLVTAGALFFRARRAPRLFAPLWRTLGVAIAILGLTTLYALVTRDILDLPPPIPTLRYLGFLAGLICLGYAALQLPVPSILPSQRTQALLDGLLISSAVFFIAWGSFLRRVVETHASQDHAWGMTLIFPFLSTALGALWVFQEARLRGGDLGWPGRFLRLGMGIMVFWWALFAFSNIQGWYRWDNVGMRLDMIPSLGILLFGLAALWPERPEWTVPGPRTWDRQNLLLLLPSSLALAYGAAVLVRGGSLDMTMVVTGTVLGGVLMLRQFLTIRDLDNLSADLDQRVQERTRALLKNQQELAKAQRSQLIAGMAAGFAHDFKNRLGVIQNWTELLGEDAAPPDLAEGLKAIRKANGEALGLVQEILAAGRLQELAPRTFEVSEFLQQVKPSLTGALGGRGSLELRVPEEPLAVHMDPEKLGGVLLNLVTNAADALEVPGTVTIQAGKDPVEPFVVLEVRDTGQGIPEEHLERIFEPFFTTKPAGRGTGLGLSSVYGTLLQSGGTVTVASQRGVGTTFTLRIPQEPPG